MPTPPIPVPPGQFVVFVSPTASTPTANGGCTATSTNTTGVNTQSFSEPLSNSFSQIVWSAFSVPSILTRPGTVIHGIYPTLIGNGHNALTVFSLNLDGTPIGGYPWNGNGAVPPDFTGQWFVSAGTNLSVFSGMTITAATTQSQSIGAYPTPDFLNTTFAGAAVYIDAPTPPSTFVSVGNSINKDVGFN
jgi:hypothetical protein